MKERQRPSSTQQPPAAHGTRTARTGTHMTSIHNTRKYAQHASVCTLARITCTVHANVSTAHKQLSNLQAPIAEPAIAPSGTTTHSIHAALTSYSHQRMSTVQQAAR